MRERLQNIRLGLSVLLVLAGCSRPILFFAEKSHLPALNQNLLSVYCFSPLPLVFDGSKFFSRFEIWLSGPGFGPINMPLKASGPWHRWRLLMQGVSGGFLNPRAVTERVLRYYYCANRYEGRGNLPSPRTVVLKNISNNGQELNSLTVECQP